jgi:glycosyltransferase involved in cell wall biosynthesis
MVAYLVKVVLFHNLREDGSRSMGRYARELAAAMRAVGKEGWQFQEVWSSSPRLGSRLIPGKPGRRLDSALGRYLQYPFKAFRASGNLFHVLDHGYSQLLLGLGGRRTVVTCHDLIPLLARVGAIPVSVSRNVALTFRFRLACMARATRVIAVSEATRRTILKFTPIPPERIVVIPHGLSQVFSPNGDAPPEGGVRSRLGIPAEARVVLHVGTRGRYKNTPTLLKTLKLLQDSGLANLWFLRVGADFHPEEHAMLDAMGLRAQTVHAGGGWSDEDLASIYRAADLFAFPSLWEGFGWPPLEAMACGTPVVTSNAASLPEVVGDAGLMCPPQDYQGLAAAMRLVLTNDDLRRDLRARGLARARRFTWEAAARKTLAVYEEVRRQATSPQRG